MNHSPQPAFRRTPAWRSRNCLPFFYLTLLPHRSSDNLGVLHDLRLVDQQTTTIHDALSNNMAPFSDALSSYRLHALAIRRFSRRITSIRSRHHTIHAQLFCWCLAEQCLSISATRRSLTTRPLFPALCRLPHLTIMASRKLILRRLADTCISSTAACTPASAPVALAPSRQCLTTARYNVLEPRSGTLFVMIKATVHLPPLHLER